MDTYKAKEFFDKQDWIFAKTYANKAPHEYIVRDNIKGKDEEFIEVMNFIMEEGMTMYFYGHYENRYIYIDGRHYWVMKDPGDDPTAIINRQNADEYFVSIKWKGSR